MVQARRASNDELALPQLAGEAVCAAVRDYADWGSRLPVYRVFGLRFWGARMLAARFEFPAAYLMDLVNARQVAQAVAVPLWGGPPVQRAIAASADRWGLDLVEADQRKQAFQLLTAIAQEVQEQAARATAMAMAAGQVVVPPGSRSIWTARGPT